MKNLILIGACLISCAAAVAAADINTDRLSDIDVGRVQDVIRKLEPLIKEREARENLAPLTFDELYAPLNGEEQAFLKSFQDLDGADVGVAIPFRGLSTGKEDLVAIRGQKITMDGQPYTIPPQFLPPGVYDSYAAMMEAMNDNLGTRLYVESGFRSSAYQLYLFVYYLKNHDYSVRETVKWVALPGYSEHSSPQHQAIDFINEDGISGETDPAAFERLPEYAWLLANAGRYGFELSYPRGREGIIFEPWHWRYEAGE